MRISDLTAVQNAITAMTIVREVIPAGHPHSHLLYAAIQALKQTVHRWTILDYEEALKEKEKRGDQ